MIQDTADINELVAPGQAEIVNVVVPVVDAAGNPTKKAFAQMGLRVLAGQAVVRDNSILPIIAGKTHTRFLLEFHSNKYRDLLAMPGPSQATLSKAVLMIGNVNHFHFFANHFPALLLLKSTTGSSATLATQMGFPPRAASLMSRVMLSITDGRPINYLTVKEGVYDVQDVIFPIRPHIAMPALMSRRLVLPLVLSEAGITNPLQELGALKLFVQRGGGGGGRNLFNQDEVQAWFERRGYTAVNPGTLTLEEQVILFSRATHIAGVEGAAMTNIIFAPHVRHIVMIASPLTEGEGFMQRLVASQGTPFDTLYGHVISDGVFLRNNDYLLPLENLEGWAAKGEIPA